VAYICADLPLRNYLFSSTSPIAHTIAFQSMVKHRHRHAFLLLWPWPWSMSFIYRRTRNTLSISRFSES